MLKAIYPGSFDPITNGHVDIIKRASAMVDVLVVGVCGNPNKHSLLTPDERVELIKEVTKEIDNVQVMRVEGMMGEFAFTNEFQRAIINKQLTGDVETIFLAASPENITLSSSSVKEILAFNGKLDMFVPAVVEAKLREKTGREG